MDSIGSRVRIGLIGMVALLLPGIVACGDDDAAGGNLGAGDISGQDSGATVDPGQGSGSDVDLCALLEVSEIETHFGQQGAVNDSQLSSTNCIWEIEDGSGEIVGQVTLFMWRPQPGQSLTEAITSDGFIEADALVPADGIGEEAYFEGPDQPALYFRTDDLAFSLFAYLNTEVAGAQDKLLVLADQVLGRL